MSVPPPALRVGSDGTLTYAGERSVLRFERHLNHPVERVWRAITDPSELAVWLAEADLDLVPGGRVELRWQNTDQDGNQAIARGVVSALEPPRLLELDTDIHGRLRWELRTAGPDEDACLLVFTATAALPAEFRLIVLAGWHTHLDFLAAALAGDAIDWPNWSDWPFAHWQEIHANYLATVTP